MDSVTSQMRTCLTGNKLKSKAKKVGMANNLNMSTRKSFSFDVGYQALTEISDTLNHNSAIPATELKSCRKMQRPHALWTPQRTWEPWAPGTAWVWAPCPPPPITVSTIRSWHLELGIHDCSTISSMSIQSEILYAQCNWG